MYSNEYKPRYPGASSCINRLAFLLLIGFVLVTVIGVILTSFELWFYPRTNSPQDTGTPTANITQTPVPLLVVEPNDGTIELPVITWVTLTPRPTRTLRPAPTGTVTCTYKIKPGDTLYSIAQRFGINDYSGIRCWSSGCSLNDPTNLGVGWEVTVPGVTDHTCLLRGGGYP